METLTVDKVALVTQRVADYGGQIAVAFHNHSLNADRVPIGFEGAINILDSTVTTLKQALELLNEEAANKGPKLFSDEGLKYVQVLTIECATTLAKIEPLLVGACLSPKEAREKRKLERKNLAKKGEPTVNPAELKLDAKAFLCTVETAKWSRVSSDIEDCMDRLYDLQLHLLLVFQVVKVGALSRDLSSGKVDVKSIVAYHDRISRTADLVGIKPPKGQSRHARTRDDSSSSDESSSDSDSRSDVEVARQRLKNIKRKMAKRPPPPPPPPPPHAFNAYNLGPPPMAPVNAADLTSFRATSNVDAGGLPPAYDPTRSPSSSPPVRDAATFVVEPTTPPTHKQQVENYTEEKWMKEEPAEDPKPLTLEPRLFKSNPKGMGFKIKSLFRSKQSLAEEMRKALSDSESQLIAYVLRGHDVKQVPHSAFHSLEATHMRTILSQLNDDSWYKTFTSLTSAENHALQPIIRPQDTGSARDVVVLKVIERNRLNSWGMLLRELFQKYPMAYQVGANRVLLVIVRETLVAGRALVGPIFGQRPPIPLPGLKKREVLRPPPGLPVPSRSNSRISDLRFPPPPSALPGWHVTFPPAIIHHGTPLPPPPPGPILVNKQILVDVEVELALTVYTEYTLRQVENHNEPGPTKTWSRIQITQESSERQDVINRIHQFEEAGGNIIELKLRLSEHQSTQVNRLMDELQFSDRDQRFEWSWAEMSLYTHSGIVAYKDIMATDQEIPFNFAPTATHIHLIAKRALRSHCIPTQVYHQFMAPPPPPGPRLGGPPPGWLGPPPPAQRPGIIHVEPARRRNFGRNRRGSYSSGSDSDAVFVSDSSEGEVRRRLRRYRARKVRSNVRRQNRSPIGSDWSGSDDDSSDDEEDVIEVKINLKRGEDVVKALLQLWTPEVEDKGNEVV